MIDRMDGRARPGRLVPWMAALAFAGAVNACSPALAQASPGAAPVHPAPCRASEALPGARCITVDVPEAYGEAGARRIQLDGVIIPAKAAADRGRRAVFVLASGPGERLTDVPAVLGVPNDEHDVIVIDQRGTGTTPDLSCARPISESNLADYAQDIFPVRDFRACLKAVSGRVDLTRYTTENAVEDIEQERLALGYGQIDLIGDSYGTRLALEYIRRHGDHVRSAGLVSPVPPQALIQSSIARHAEAGLQGVIDRCLDEAPCRAAFPDLHADLEKLERRLSGEGVWYRPAGGPPVRLSRGLVGSWLRAATYSADEDSFIPLAIHTLASGDDPAVVKRAVEWRERFATFVVFGMFLSVECAEDVPPMDMAAERRDAAGTLLGDYRVEQIGAACEGWPRGHVPPDFHAPLSSNVPTILFHGAYDPVVDRTYVEQVAHGFSDVRILTMESTGHFPYPAVAGRCVNAVLAAFLKRPDSKSLDARCVETIPFPSFQLAGPPAR
jgi:pimeloyl-ACP methyl ester carboxylesterase